MPKETGLMFKAPLVLAILAGQKTQTRRVLSDRTLQLLEYGSIAGECHELPTSGALHPNSVDYYNSFCPMGQPGDRIYVRETFMDLRGTGVEHRPDPRGPLQRYAYRAETLPGSSGDAACKDYGLKWSPAIHMPKDLARIWLEITGVRVERLQEITEGDAEREGVQLKDGSDEPYSETNRDGFRYRNYQSKEGTLDCGSARESFRTLWESTGGDWAANPWVWVIDFKTISTTGRPA